MKLCQISSVQNFCMVPKNAFPAFKAVALAGKVAAICNVDTVFLRSCGKSSKWWISMKSLENTENPENFENGRGDFTLCRDLPGQCHRFKRRKRVFWHHKNILYWGNFVKFHLEQQNLFFCSGNSRKWRILVKIINFGRFWWILIKFDQNPPFSKISETKKYI